MTKTVDFLNLPRFQERTFLPLSADFQDAETVKSFYKALLDEPINSISELEVWLSKRSELESALSQQEAVLYIRMTCQTDDDIRVKAFKNFLEIIEPLVKQYNDELNRKFIQTLKSHPLDEGRYGVYIREIKSALEIFRKENISLQTQEQLLCQEYQSICGAMTVGFEGREQTLPQMAKYLIESDRSLRERAWRASAQRRLQDKDKLDELFEKMLVLRQKIAENAGFANYRDYKFKSLGRFDYTPEDCKQYHRSIENFVVPLWGRILRKRKEALGVDRLRPWDGSVDEQGRAPLKPFEGADQLIEGCIKIFSDMDKTLGEEFAGMAQQGLLDLESRKGKAPGGYQHALHEARLPFIFMNAVGLDSDMRTLLHEAGHAFHSLACRYDPLFEYRHGPMEFNEVASMAMEILPQERINVFYSKEETERSIDSHLKDIVFTLCWVALIDCFQHWIYENPSHTKEERNQKWLSLRRRFGADFMDWDGLEAEHTYLWHRQLHIFEVPFYYIEYGIAQLGALQIWRHAKKDRKKALDDYKRGLSLGGAKPLPQLYEAAGIKFDFSSQTIAPLMEAIIEELKKKNPHF